MQHNIAHLHEYCPTEFEYSEEKAGKYESTPHQEKSMFQRSIPSSRRDIFTLDLAPQLTANSLETNYRFIKSCLRVVLGRLCNC